MSPRSGIAVRTNHFRSGLGRENEISARGAVIMRSTTAGGFTQPSFLRTSSGFHDSWATAIAGSQVRVMAATRNARRNTDRNAPVMQASKGRFEGVKATTIEYGWSLYRAGLMCLVVMVLADRLSEREECQPDQHNRQAHHGRKVSQREDGGCGEDRYHEANRLDWSARAGQRQRHSTRIKQNGRGEESSTWATEWVSGVAQSSFDRRRVGDDTEQHREMNDGIRVARQHRLRLSAGIFERVIEFNLVADEIRPPHRAGDRYAQNRRDQL